MRKVGYDVQLHYERIQRRQAVADAERIMPGIMPPGGDWVTEVQSYCRTVSEIMGRDDDIRSPPPPLPPVSAAFLSRL